LSLAFSQAADLTRWAASEASDPGPRGPLQVPDLRSIRRPAW